MRTRISVKDLLRAKELFEKAESDVKDIWHPEFGWILRDGKPTDNSEAFLKWMTSKPECTHINRTTSNGVHYSCLECGIYPLSRLTREK